MVPLNPKTPRFGSKVAINPSKEKHSDQKYKSKNRNSGTTNKKKKKTGTKPLNKSAEKSQKSLRERLKPYLNNKKLF